MLGDWAATGAVRTRVDTRADSRAEVRTIGLARVDFNGSKMPNDAESVREIIAREAAGLAGIVMIRECRARTPETR